MAATESGVLDNLGASISKFSFYSALPLFPKLDPVNELDPLSIEDLQTEKKWETRMGLKWTSGHFDYNLQVRAQAFTLECVMSVARKLVQV